MDRVTAWGIRPTSVNLICQAIVPPGSRSLPEFDFNESPDGLEMLTDAIPWRIAHVQHGEFSFNVHVYRKRAVVSWKFTEKYYATLAETGSKSRKPVGCEQKIEQSATPAKGPQHARIDDYLRFYLANLAADMHACLEATIEIGDEAYWNTIPLLLGDLVTDRSVQEPWISDGMTTSYMRVFDSATRQVGFIRVSRHLIMAAGIGPRIQQEVVNLLYEKLLYYDERTIDHVFDFLDGLARYTLPTELSLFLEETVARLSVFLAVIAILLAVIQIFADGLALPGKFILLVMSVVVVVVSWFTLQRMQLVRWE